eukprot:1865971-Pyramimonas_sp.AAC.1
MQGTFPQLRAKVFDSTGSMEEAFTGVYYDEDGDSVSLFRDCHFQELLRNSSLWLPRSTMKTKLESLSGRSDNEMNKRWFTEMASSLHGSHRLFISLSDLPERLSSFIFIVDLVTIAKRLECAGQRRRTGRLHMPVHVGRCSVRLGGCREAASTVRAVRSVKIGRVGVVSTVDGDRQRPFG